MGERKNEINEFENLVKQVAPNYVVEGVKYVWQTLEFSILWGIYLGEDFAVDRGILGGSGWRGVTQTRLLDEEWDDIVEELFCDENYDELFYEADIPYEKFDQYFECDRDWFEEADFKKLRIKILMPEDLVTHLAQSFERREVELSGTYRRDDFEFDRYDYAVTFEDDYSWLNTSKKYGFDPEKGLEDLEVTWNLVNGKLI